MPRAANQTSFKPGNRLSPKMVRGSDGKFAAKAPTPRLVRTDVDAPETVSRLYEGDGTQKHRTQFPSKLHPWPEYVDGIPGLLQPLDPWPEPGRAPDNLFDAVKGPAQTAKLTRGEIIALTAMSVIGIALIASGLVWL